MRRTDVEAQLQEAIRLAQAGQHGEARQLLDAIVQADPQHELAWLWLASVATGREERIRFLARTLALNPDNARAQAAYTRLTGAAFVSPETPETPGAPPAGPRDVAGGRSIVRRVQQLSPSATALFVVLALAVVVIAVAVLMVDVFGGDDGASAATPSPTRRPPTLTPGPSPTPTWTPLPTATPGPSPTSIWDAAPPTWTPAPALADDTPVPTARPTRTPVPESPESPPDDQGDSVE